MALEPRFTKGYFQFCPYTDQFFEASNDTRNGVFVYATEEELQASPSTHPMSPEFTQKWIQTILALDGLTQELETAYNNYEQN